MAGRRIVTTLVLAATLALASAPAHSAQVRVGLSQNPPLIFPGTGGEPSGIFIDVINNIAAAEGWDIAFVPCVWRTCLGMLETGELDLLSSIARSAQRERVFDFSGEVVFSNWARVYRAPDVAVESIVDLAGKRVATVRGSIHTRVLKDMLKKFDINAEIVEVADYSDVFVAIEEGRAHAGVSTKAKGFLEALKYEVDKSPVIFNPVGLYFAAPRGKNASLLAAIDRNMRRMKADPDSVYYQSLEHWLDPASFAMSKKPAMGSGAIVFAGDMNYAPLESLHRGNPEGLNVDLLRELGMRMGAGVDIRLMDWPEAQHQVLYGEADALTLLSHSKERDKLYDFSAPTIEVQFALFILSDDLTINALHDLKGKTVALTRGGYPRQVIEPMEGVRVVFVDSYIEGFELLKGGEADAVASGKWVGTYALQEHGVEGVKVLQEPFATRNVSIAVKKGNAALLGRINDAIKMMRADGAIAGIVRKWSPQKVVFLTQEKLHHMKYAAVGFMLALAVSGGGLWFYSLRGHVRRKTRTIETARAELEQRVHERTRELTEAIKVHELTEEALSASEKKYRSIFETAGNLITSVDTDGTIVECNSRMKDLLGYERQEVIGQNMGKIIHPDYLVRAQESLAQIIETGSSYNKVYKMIRKDGSLVDVSINSAGLFDPEGGFQRTICIIDDITERKLLDEERLRSQKLESLGVLAGGIAHDFNNLLTGVFGNLSLAKHFINPDDKAMGRIIATEEALKRAKGLTYQLLTFARGGEPVKKAVCMADLLKNSVRFSLSGSNVKCAFEISDDLCDVQADEGQISQVLQNIVLNAQQAMPEGGELHVSAINITSDGEDAMLPVGRYVRLSIQDHGIGIPEEHLTKIFDPYYTTKHKGSGLGLASAYSIVNKHHGLITVQSELGRGTTFHIHLPAAVERSSRCEEARDELVTGHGRVLVMDDESIVLDVAREMLNAIGYEVGTSRDGQHAVELYQRARENGEPFDAVIMDLTVPGGMGGREAIKRILAMDPGARAIVSSGYSEDPIMTSFREYGFAGVIKKPYQLAEVSRTLSDVINYHASGTA